MQSFLLIFFTLYLAQMGDKTQLLTIYLATKTKKHLLLFWGILTGYLISEAAVVLFGTAIGAFIPQNIVQIVSGIIFIILGILLFHDGKQKKQKHKKLPMRHIFFTAVTLILMADIGDKTQIAIALFAATNNPFVVYAAAISALGLDTLIMIAFSKIIMKKIQEDVVEKIAGIVFWLVGTLLLIQVG